MQVSAEQIASLLDATIKGDGQVKVSKPSKIEEGTPGTITFLGNSKYEEYLYTTKASIVILQKDFELREPISATQILVEDVYQSLSILLNHFGNQGGGPEGISDLAFSETSFDASVNIGAFTVIGKNVNIAAGSTIFPQCYIGDNVKIGKDCIIYPGVKIYKDCVIGDRCIIHSNAVIGSDGFGFAPTKDGSYKKIAQVGNVILEDDVEIGALTVVDRGSIGSTRVLKGAKLDNLIQIAHNVEIGSNTVIAAQAGIAGSTKIGNSCRIGGQAGFVGHIEIADGTMVQAQSGVPTSVKEPKTALYGSPAIGYRNYLKSYSLFKKLPDLQQKIQELESKVKALETK